MVPRNCEPFHTRTRVSWSVDPGVIPAKLDISTRSAVTRDVEGPVSGMLV